MMDKWGKTEGKTMHNWWKNYEQMEIDGRMNRAPQPQTKLFNQDQLAETTCFLGVFCVIHRVLPVEN